MKKYVPLSLLLLTFSVGACSQLFSKGRPAYNKAEDLWEKQKDGAAALVKISEALLKDAKLKAAKRFLFKHYDAIEASIQSSLTNPQKSSNPDIAAKNVDIYNNLIKFHANLQKLKLPITLKDQSWTIKIVDYQPQLAEARKNAHQVFFTHAEQQLTAHEIGKAKTFFRGALSYFDGSAEEKAAVTQKIAGLYATYAEKLEKSTDIEALRKGVDAANVALYFVKDFERAAKILPVLKNNLANAFVRKGRQAMAKGDVDSLKQAVKDFTTALKWDKAVTEAQTGLDTAKEKLAAHFYALGKKAERNKTHEGVKAALEAYNTALEWVKDYKDTAQRIVKVKIVGANLRIGDQLKELAKHIGDTEKEVGAFETSFGKIDGGVKKSVEVMDSITSISERVRTTNEKLKATTKTINLFTTIPVVSTVTNVLHSTLKMAQKPVGQLAQKLTDIEKPVITPTKEKLAKVDGAMTRFGEKIAQVKEKVKFTRVSIQRLNQCVVAVDALDKLDAVEVSVKAANKQLPHMNKQLNKANSSINQLMGVFGNFHAIQPIVNKVNGGLKKVEKPVGKVSGVLSKLDKVLSKKFTLNILVKKWTFSVKDILGGAANGVGKLKKEFMKLARKAVDPLLNKLKIKLPEIPGIQQMIDEANKMKERSEKVTQYVTTLDQKIGGELAKRQAALGGDLQKALDAAGCK